MTVIGVIVALIVAVAAAAAGYFIGYNNRKKTAEAQIGSAEAEATRLVNEAIKTADQKRKEAILEAKDEAFRLKAEVDAQQSKCANPFCWRRSCCKYRIMVNSSVMELETGVPVANTTPLPSVISSM